LIGPGPRCGGPSSDAAWYQAVTAASPRSPGFDDRMSRRFGDSLIVRKAAISACEVQR
jgi:hypothetical protein